MKTGSAPGLSATASQIARTFAMRPSSAYCSEMRSPFEICESALPSGYASLTVKL